MCAACYGCAAAVPRVWGQFELGGARGGQALMLVRTPEGDSTALHLLPRSVRQRGEVVWKAQAKKNVISQFHQVAPPAARTAPPPGAAAPNLYPPCPEDCPLACSCGTAACRFPAAAS